MLVLKIFYTFFILKFREAINSVYFLNNDIISTGDDQGEIKIWDIRNTKSSIYEVKE